MRLWWKYWWMRLFFITTNTLFKHLKKKLTKMLYFVQMKLLQRCTMTTAPPKVLLHPPDFSSSSLSFLSSPPPLSTHSLSSAICYRTSGQLLPSLPKWWYSSQPISIARVQGGTSSVQEKQTALPLLLWVLRYYFPRKVCLLPWQRWYSSWAGFKGTKWRYWFWALRLLEIFI